MRAIGVGVDEGFEAFFAAHWVRLVRTLSSYGGDREVAEEAAQEAFVRASRDWRRVAAVTSPVGWLFTVGINEVNGHVRRGRARSRGLRRLDAPGAVESVDVSAVMTVREAMRPLPGPQRAAVALYYLAHLPVAEVAAVLDTPEGTVESWLARGRGGLRARLDPDHAAVDEEDHDAR